MAGRLNKIFPRGRVIDTVVAQDTDIFGTGLVVERPAVLRINVAFSANTVLYVTGISATRLALNDGWALDADEMYAFDVPVRNGDEVNFQISVGGTVRLFDVTEIPWGA